VIGSIIGIVFAVVGMFSAQKAMEDQQKIFGKADAEKSTKNIAGALGLVSNVADFFHKLISHPVYKMTGLPLARGLPKTVEGVLKFGLVKVLGSAAAAISVYWDICYAVEAAKKEQYGIMGLYIASAALGIASIVLLWITASTGIGLAVLALTVAIAWAIAYFKDDKIQEWLGQCLFGNDKEKFLDARMEELKLREIMPAEEPAAA
jgi:hypothetical protein